MTLPVNKVLFLTHTFAIYYYKYLYTVLFTLCVYFFAYPYRINKFYLLFEIFIFCFSVISVSTQQLNIFLNHIFYWNVRPLAQFILS
jgi:hypothetical protein